MSNEIKTYYVTDKAPTKIYGKRHKGTGSPIKMTEKQAEQLLRTLQITDKKPGAKTAPKKDDDAGSKSADGKTTKPDAK